MTTLCSWATAHEENCHEESQQAVRIRHSDLITRSAVCDAGRFTRKHGREEAGKEQHVLHDAAAVSAVRVLATCIHGPRARKAAAQ